MNYKIMIVEDDPDIAELVSFHLHKIWIFRSSLQRFL